MLLAIFDSIDDTVLVKKIIISVSVTTCVYIIGQEIGKVLAIFLKCLVLLLCSSMDFCNFVSKTAFDSDTEVLIPFVGVIQSFW